MEAQWIGNGQQVGASTLAALLTYHQTAEWNSLQVYATHTNILFTGLTALLGVGFYVSVQPGREYVVISFLFPLFLVALRRSAIEILDRYYRRFLEAVVVTAKLEFLSGLHKKVCSDNVSAETKDALLLFPQDNYLDVHRRWESRANTKTMNSGYWIVDFMGRGHNGVAWTFFHKILFFSCLIPCVAFLCWILRNHVNFSIYFVAAATIDFVGITLFYWWDSWVIWEQRVKTSLPDREADWDAIVRRTLRGKDAQQLNETPKKQAEATSQ